MKPGAVPPPVASDDAAPVSHETAPSATASTAGLASVKTALASTASRTLTLYFARPARLFRPVKLSAWHALSAQGESLPHLVRRRGWTAIPRHFLPPLAVNAFLGTVLWATYAEASARLSSGTSSSSSAANAALAGACAGAVQALAAAPAENVRLVLEGGSSAGWSAAWREVFLTRAGATSPASDVDGSSSKRRHADARRVFRWVRDARAMAGRGWHGLPFGVAKDACGFAAFFAIFDVSHRAASTAAAQAQAAPRLARSTTIVAGGLFAGLAYELVARPFDAARRLMLVHHVPAAALPARVVRAAGGVRSLFRDPDHASASASSRRARAWIRLLGRVGPWGVAFWVWETFGSSLPSPAAADT